MPTYQITFTMPAQLRADWLEGLRSGEYRQSVGVLRAGDGYCCLGVMQMVVDGDVEQGPANVACGMPSAKWLHEHGVNQLVPDDMYPTFLRLPYAASDETAPAITTLNCLNDKYRLSFNQIADLIEKHSEGY